MTTQQLQIQIQKELVKHDIEFYEFGSNTIIVLTSKNKIGRDERDVMTVSYSYDFLICECEFCKDKEKISYRIDIYCNGQIISTKDIDDAIQVIKKAIDESVILYNEKPNKDFLKEVIKYEKKHNKKRTN